MTIGNEIIKNNICITHNLESIPRMDRFKLSFIAVHQDDNTFKVVKDKFLGECNRVLSYMELLDYLKLIENNRIKMNKEKKIFNENQDMLLKKLNINLEQFN